MNKLRAGYRFTFYDFGIIYHIEDYAEPELSSKGQDYILNERRKWVRKMIPEWG